MYPLIVSLRPAKNPPSPDQVLRTGASVSWPDGREILLNQSPACPVESTAEALRGRRVLKSSILAREELAALKAMDAWFIEEIDRGDEATRQREKE